MNKVKVFIKTTAVMILWLFSTNWIAQEALMQQFFIHEPFLAYFVALMITLIILIMWYTIWAIFSDK